MNPASPTPAMYFPRLLARFLLPTVAALITGLVTPAPAQAPSTGTLTGRVLNRETGSYLNNARIAIQGVREPVFTNEFGEYRAPGVPAGAVRVTVFYTGLPEQSAEVIVAGGQSVTRDFSLSRTGDQPEGEPVIMTPFVVAAERNTNARAIAVNEQRFAPNLKNVVSTDEFGDLGNSSVGDFVKFLPGVIVDGEQMSVRGLPPHSVPLSVDGNRLATQFAGEQGLRAAALDSAALNNVARIEIYKSPTPDLPADSLGGSVNLISKRAFERKTPLFSYHTYLTGDTDHLTLAVEPGPSDRTTARPLRPGFDFTYVKPVSSTFGFTLTGQAFNQLNTDYMVRRFWVPNMVARAGGTATNPYMAQFSLQNGVTYKARDSVGATIDWKFRPEDVLSVGLQYTYALTDFNTYTHNSDVSGQTATLVPTSYGPTFTQGAAGAARLQFAGSTRSVPITTVMISGNHRHEGTVWQFDTGGFFSKSSSKLRDIDFGHFRNTQLRLNSATIRFDGIGPDFPAKETVINSSGTAVDPYDVGNYQIQTVFSQPKNELDYIYGGHSNAQRILSLAVPVTVKAGIDWREQIRDLRSPFPRWNFVGPDRVAGTADDQASRYDVASTTYTDGGGPFSGVQTIQWPNQYKLYTLFQEHPEYFAFDEAGTISNSTAASKKIVETISAAYIRGDLRLIDNRLWLVGGVRFEHTTDFGQGQRNDIRATYQQDAKGALVLDSSGRPIRISSDAVVRARAQYTERGASAERTYQNFYPSVNATFNATENLIARLAYARTFGRPDFVSIVPSIAITDPTAAATARTIRVSDPGLKPWTSNNYDFALEYYFKPSGLVSAGVFRKDLTNFFGSTRTPATLEKLADFGLSDDFLDYDIISNTNVGDARVTGFELNCRQELAFLPAWARGVQIFGNLTQLRLQGSNAADFDSFIPRSYNWGVSLNRPRYTIRLNWHARGRQRRDQVTGSFIPDGTFVYTAPFTTLDLNGEIRVSRLVTLYAVVRNATKSTRPEQYYNSETPEYAKQRSHSTMPVSFTIGLKGDF